MKEHRKLTFKRTVVFLTEFLGIHFRHPSFAGATSASAMTAYPSRARCAHVSSAAASAHPDQTSSPVATTRGTLVSLAEATMHMGHLPDVWLAVVLSGAKVG